MKTKKITALVLALMLLLSLCACGNESPEAAPAETGAPVETLVTDMIGRELSVSPGSYERVVCIGAGALRLYSYIGDTSLLCGVEDIDNTALEERPKMFDTVARPYLLAFEETFKTLPSCGVGGPQAQTAEAEKILSCAPDIVISAYEDLEKENALQEQLGVPVVTVKTGPGGVFDPAFKGSMALLGQVFGREDRAEALNAFVEAQSAEISARTAQVSEDEKPAVYICGLGNWGTTDHLMTAQSYLPFDIANVKNVLTDLGNTGVGAIEEEKFEAIAGDMDIMLIDAAAVKNIRPLYQQDPAIFDSCKAWQEGEVYLQMAYNAYYTNCETALINTWFIAKTVYPQLFEDVDMAAKTDEVTEMFLGAELSQAIFACPSSFGGYQRIDPASFFA